MRLLYFVQYFPPERAAGLSLVRDMLEGFADMGWQVDVYTPTPTRGVTRAERRAFRRRRVERQASGRLVIHRMPLYREGKGFAQRAVRYALFSLECLIVGLRVPADAVFASNGPPTQGLAMGLLSRWTGKPIVYNLQDLFPDSMLNAGLATERAPIVRLGRRLERFTYKNVNALVTISEDMADNLRRKGVPEGKLSIVPNWIDTDAIRPVSREANGLFDDLGLDRRRFYVLYSGNMGYTTGLEALIEAAKRVQDVAPDVGFLLFGDGSRRPALMALAEKLSLNNVAFYPFQPEARVPEVYGLGDVALISGRPGLSGVSMPSKTWTILAAGRGILAAFDRDSALARTIAAADCGVCVDPGNPAALAAAVLALRADKARCARWGENARRYAEANVSKARGVAEYARIIEATARQKKGRQN